MQMGGVMDSEGVFAAARSVRWYLPDLVGPDADRVDGALAELLAERWNDEGETRLRGVLQSSEGTSAFLEAVLDDAPHFRPPQVRPGAFKGGGYSSLPGNIGAVDAPMYRCPVGNDYDWWRQAVGTPIPVCPTHGRVLVRA
jgi:hypothetical protein